MKIKYHTISSLPLGVGYYLLSNNVSTTLLAMITTIIIDGDHVSDYVMAQKKLSPLKEMIQAFESLKFIHKNYLLLHSWELIIAYGIALLFFPNPYALAIFIGYVLHVLTDQIYNVHFLGKYNVKDLFYFFTYRLTKNFDVLKLRKHGDTINIDATIY